MSASSDTHQRWPMSALSQVFTRQPALLPALDGLRAAAVLLVICDHWGSLWTERMPGFPTPGLLRTPMFHWGWTGVDLFFVLSGFLIGRQLWGELLRSGTIDFGRFIVRRGLRIWPLYFATMIALLVTDNPASPTWPDWVMLSNYWHTHYGRGWSLSTEEQFYLLVPVLLVLLKRFVPRDRWPFSIMAILAAVVLGRFLTFRHYVGQGLDPAYILGQIMYAPFHLHCEPLLAGLLAAWISVERPTWIEPAHDGAIARRVVLTGLAIAAAGLVLRALNRESFNYLALGSMYGAALCIAIADRSLLTAVLRWRIWGVIARLSFGMYLNHLMMVELTDEYLKASVALLPSTPTFASLLGYGLSVLTSALLAMVTYVVIEYPGLALRDRILHRRERARGSAVTTA